MSTAAVVVTHGRECLSACLDAIVPQVDHTVLVVHRERQPTPHTVTEVRYDEELPNISRMWNVGIGAAGAGLVAVLNDDAVVGPTWFADVASAMGETGAAVGYASASVSRRSVNRTPGPTTERMSGYAWVLRPGSGLRLDESMVWWFSDNDLEWQARRDGGVVCVPGRVTHLHPNSTTVGVLQEQAARDRETFLGKWGILP